jgi:PiT family inorganic phosphate transporter
MFAWFRRLLPHEERFFEMLGHAGMMRRRPCRGFCAETGGAIILFMAAGLGVPVSTPHTIIDIDIGIGIGAAHQRGAQRGALGGWRAASWWPR